MVGKPGSGRHPGFKHSEDTKKKIADAMRGATLSVEHKENIAQAKAMYDLDDKCIRRFEDLKATYPEQEEFFDENEVDILFAMRDLRTEKELSDISKHIESVRLRPEEPYQYSSSSCYAAEDVMIALLDFKKYLQKIQNLH